MTRFVMALLFKTSGGQGPGVCLLGEDGQVHVSADSALVSPRFFDAEEDALPFFSHYRARSWSCMMVPVEGTPTLAECIEQVKVPTAPLDRERSGREWRERNRVDRRRKGRTRPPINPGEPM